MLARGTGACGNSFNTWPGSGGSWIAGDASFQECKVDAIYLMNIAIAGCNRTRMIVTDPPPEVPAPGQGLFENTGSVKQVGFRVEQIVLADPQAPAPERPIDLHQADIDVVGGRKDSFGLGQRAAV